MAEDNIKQGWARPLNASKFHYFVKGDSLCGHWMFLGRDFEPDEYESTDDCRVCRRRLNAIKETSNG